MAQNTLTTTALVVVVAIGCRLGRFRPAAQHALWVVVLVKFALPPIVCWP